MSTIASKPAASARSSSEAVSARSLNTYSWNHRRAPSGMPLPTASIGVFESEERQKIASAAAAPAELASSPRSSARQWKAVGATRIGVVGAPSSSVSIETSETSRSTCGSSSIRSKAARLRPIVISSPAPER